MTFLTGKNSIFLNVRLQVEIYSAICGTEVYLLTLDAVKKVNF